MSGKVLELKRWEPCPYLPDGPDGPEIRMELKRLKRHERKALDKVLMIAFTELERSGDANLTPSQKAAIMSNVFEAVPAEDLQALFSNCVRNIDGLRIDDTAITRGSELLEEADDSTLFFVLMNLKKLASLSAAEAFRSGSRSTSSAETASLPALPASDATPTESADGPLPSDATVEEVLVGASTDTARA